MKIQLLTIILLFPLFTHAQSKYSYVQYNKFIEVTGTPYVIATVDHHSKAATSKEHLMFINTSSSEKKEISLPDGAFIRNLEQVRIDSLGINKIIARGRTVNLNGKKSITWSDPEQLIILSPDGSEKIQVTDDQFFVSAYVVNKITGRMVIAGHRDTNNNGKYDHEDANEVFLYDLQHMTIVGK